MITKINKNLNKLINLLMRQTTHPTSAEYLAKAKELGFVEDERQ